MLKDYRECFATDLRDPEFQKEFITASYEEDGTDGVLRALRVISSTDQDGHSEGGTTDFTAVRSALNALNLDLALVSK